MSVIENDLNPDVFIGISLPLGHGEQGFFNKTKKALEQTRSNIRNLLLTRKGERLGNPNFGSNLLSVVFEPNTSDINNKIEETIRSAMREFLPQVQIESIDIKQSERIPEIVNVRLQFSLEVAPDIDEVNLSLDTTSGSTGGSSGGSGGGGY